MVGRQADHRVVSDPIGLQLLQHIGQGSLQLQIGGHIGLYRRGGVGVGGLGGGTVLGGHGVAPAVAAVAADSHVVGVEGLSRGEIGVHVAVHRGLHHLQIGVGPATAGAAGQRQTVADALIVVAQIGVSGIAVIVVVGVVVPRGGLIAQRAELVAQYQRHIVIAAGPEADVVVDPCGQQAGEDGKFAAGGGLPPAGLVVVGADEALVGQTVQRRGQLLGDEPRRKGLRRQQDQILALEHPGILVLPGGSARRHIAVDGG